VVGALTNWKKAEIFGTRPRRGTRARWVLFLPNMIPHGARLVVLVVVVATSSLAFAACGGGGAAIPPDGDGGAPGATNNPPGCPATLPATPASCALAEGTTCWYGDAQCGGPSATCVMGQWSIGQVRMAPFECPANAPAEGATCCAPDGKKCAYDCAHGNGAETAATCIGKKWSIEKFRTACVDADTPCTPGGATCGAGAQCVCCGSAGPRPICVCSTSCTGAGDTQCTDPFRSKCNRPSGGDPGICTSPSFNCCWGCQ
jgi:hypothetical protein